MAVWEELYDMREVLMQDEEELQQMLDETEDIIEEKETELQVYLELVERYVQDKDFESAGELLKGVLDQYPDNAIANYYQAYVCMKKREFLGCQTCLRKVLEQFPDHEFAKEYYEKISNHILSQNHLEKQKIRRRKLCRCLF